MRPLLLSLLLLLTLAACAPDPRTQADADNSRLLVAQRVLSQQAARAQALAVLQASTQTLVVGLQFVTLALAIGLSLSLLGAGTGLGWAGWRLGHAAARAAEVRANQVHMDRDTRTFPLLLQYLERGVYTCTNANTGSVVRLDTRRPEHAALVSAITAVTHDGILARELAHAQPSTQSLIQQFEMMVNHAHVPAND